MDSCLLLPIFNPSGIRKHAAVQAQDDKPFFFCHSERNEESYTRDIHANTQPPCIVRFAGRIRFLTRASFRNDMDEYITPPCHIKHSEISYTSDNHANA